MRPHSSDGMLARKLREGEVVYGLLTKMSAPAILEMAGHAGFDFAVIDTEHGVAGSAELEHHLRAADSAGIEVVVRVGSAESVETLRALDTGATGIIAPHVNDAEAARSAVRAAHYPPVGERGLAVSTRAGKHGKNPIAEHVRSAQEDTVVIVQVEHAEALENVREIAATEYVNAVFLGPNDLALSLGHPGELKHPSVVEAIECVAEGVIETSGAALCVLVSSEDEARSWEERGARMILFSATALLGERLGQVVAGQRAAIQDKFKEDGEPAGSVVENNRKRERRGV